MGYIRTNFACFLNFLITSKLLEVTEEIYIECLRIVLLVEFMSKKKFSFLSRLILFSSIFSLNLKTYASEDMKQKCSYFFTSRESLDETNPFRMDERGDLINPDYTVEEVEEWGNKNSKFNNEFLKFFGIDKDFGNYRYQDIFKCADVGVYRKGVTSEDVDKLKKTLQIWEE